MNYQQAVILASDFNFNQCKDSAEYYSKMAQFWEVHTQNTHQYDGDHCTQLQEALYKIEVDFAQATLNIK